MKFPLNLNYGGKIIGEMGPCVPINGSVLEVLVNVFHQG